MGFRRRMILLAAGAVATAVVIASVVVYFVTRGELIGQVDMSLREKPQSVQFQSALNVPVLAKLEKEGKLPPGATAQLGVALHDGGVAGGQRVAGGSVAGGGSEASGASEASGGVVAPASGAARSASPVEGVAHVKALPGTVTVTRASIAGTQNGKRLPPAAQRRLERMVATRTKLILPQQKLGGATGYVQLYQTDGRVLHSQTHGSLLPVTAATRAVAAGKRGAYYSDVTVAGTPVRMLTERAAPGGVWQVALPLGDLDSTLSHLRLVLALVCLGGIALAAALGLLVSRAALVPVRKLTGAAERVTRTQDLAHRIDAAGDDDLGRLAESFNTMLAALERSRLAQRQLVSDASHELRTPLTSVRANLDALALGERLDTRERARIVASVQAQLRELTVLVGDLVDLSKTDVEQIEVEDVRLDLAAASAVRRARLHAPRCDFALDAEPCLVRAAPARLDRAIANLLDNACEWNPPGAGPVEVRVRDGTLSVRDHGPGIACEDLTRVFDRFYRAPAARARPGSGLGLAIVRQTAEQHGGSVHAVNDPCGGARLTLELPALQLAPADLEPAVQQSPRPL